MIAASATLIVAGCSVDPGPEAGDAEEASTDGAQDAWPSVDDFAINGSEAPPQLVQASVVTLSVDASDDQAISVVEFFEDGVSIGVGELGASDDTNYVFEHVVSGDAFNGLHHYTVTVTDSGGQAVAAGPISLGIDVPSSGTLPWAHRTGGGRAKTVSSMETY